MGGRSAPRVAAGSSVASFALEVSLNNQDFARARGVRNVRAADARVADAGVGAVVGRHRLLARAHGGPACDRRCRFGGSHLQHAQPNSIPLPPKRSVAQRDEHLADSEASRRRSPTPASGVGGDDGARLVELTNAQQYSPPLPFAFFDPALALSPAAGPRDSTTAIYVLGARFSPLTEAARCSFRRGNAAPLVLGATRHNETTIECAPLDPTAVPSLGSAAADRPLAVEVSLNARDYFTDPNPSDASLAPPTTTRAAASASTRASSRRSVNLADDRPRARRHDVALSSALRRGDRRRPPAMPLRGRIARRAVEANETADNGGGLVSWCRRSTSCVSTREMPTVPPPPTLPPSAATRATCSLRRGCTVARGAGVLRLRAPPPPTDVHVQYAVPADGGGRGSTSRRRARRRSASFTSMQIVLDGDEEHGLCVRLGLPQPPTAGGGCAGAGLGVLLRVELPLPRRAGTQAARPVVLAPRAARAADASSLQLDGRTVARRRLWDPRPPRGGAWRRRRGEGGGRRRAARAGAVRRREPRCAPRRRSGHRRRRGGLRRLMDGTPPDKVPELDNAPEKAIPSARSPAAAGTAPCRCRLR